MPDVPPSVLVVDDEIQIRRFLRTGFELDGFTVQEAETGADIQKPVNPASLQQQKGCPHIQPRSQFFYTPGVDAVLIHLLIAPYMPAIGDKVGVAVGLPVGLHA